MKKTILKKTIATTLCLSTLLGFSSTTALAGQSDIQPTTIPVETPSTYRSIQIGNFLFDGYIMVRPSYNSYQGYVIISHPDAVSIQVNGVTTQGSRAQVSTMGNHILDTNPYVTFHVVATLSSGETERVSRTFSVYDLMMGN